MVKRDIKRYSWMLKLHLRFHATKKLKMSGATCKFWDEVLIQVTKVLNTLRVFSLKILNHRESRKHRVKIKW